MKSLHSELELEQNKHKRENMSQKAEKTTMVVVSSTGMQPSSC